jgi:hypothetical protein
MVAVDGAAVRKLAWKNISWREYWCEARRRLNYLPTGRVSSEVCKSVCEPIVNLVKCDLPVRALNHGLNDNGNSIGINSSNNEVRVKSDTTKAVLHCSYKLSIIFSNISTRTDNLAILS